MLSPWNAGTAEQQLRGTRLFDFEHLLRTGHHGGRHCSRPGCSAGQEGQVRRYRTQGRLQRNCRRQQTGGRPGCSCHTLQLQLVWLLTAARSVTPLNLRSAVDLFCPYDQRRSEYLALCDFTMVLQAQTTVHTISIHWCPAYTRTSFVSTCSVYDLQCYWQVHADEAHVTAAECVRSTVLTQHACRPPGTAALRRQVCASSRMSYCHTTL